MRGKIVKGIAGFYYVYADDGYVYECRAKGIFRKENETPLVGDNVEVEILAEDGRKGNITAILERSSRLIRPAVSNVDQMVVIFAVAKPQPNFNLLDRFLIMLERHKLPCVICFNKIDLDRENAGETFRKIYGGCGYTVLNVSAENGTGIENLKEALSGKTSAVAGPSGVGKSSLINRVQSGIVMETGTVSRKIERGRHTTRHSELIPLNIDAKRKQGYILDTPGFSSLGLFDLTKEELSSCYREFVPYEKYCRFAGCSHISEPDCRVKQALEEGEIAKMRYDNYVLLYEELKNARPRNGGKTEK